MRGVASYTHLDYKKNLDITKELKHNQSQNSQKITVLTGKNNIL
jgi:hypothetical protein